MKNLKNGIAILFLLLVNQNVFPNEVSAKDVIQEFYKSYLNYNYHLTPTIPQPELKFSKSFSDEVEKNKNICKKYADGYICGWAADSDEYLNTQDRDEKLNYNNSAIKVVEVSPNTIRVSLNVFPFEKNNKDYETVVTYKMVKENGQWVADDVIYEDKYSSLDQMKKENESNILNASKESEIKK